MATIVRTGGGGADLSVVTAAAADVLASKVIVNASGNPITGTIASKAAATITPGTTNQTIAAGQYLSGVQTISGDPDLVASNIKNGVDIFGVVGTSKAVVQHEVFTCGPASPGTYNEVKTCAKRPLSVTAFCGVGSSPGVGTGEVLCWSDDGTAKYASGSESRITANSLVISGLTVTINWTCTAVAWVVLYVVEEV